MIRNKRNQAILLAGVMLLTVLSGGCGASEKPSQAEDESRTAETTESTETSESPEQSEPSEEAESPESSEPSEEAEAINPSDQEETSAIENNGGYFVRVGDKIYFRVYGDEVLEDVSLWGNFLEYGGKPGKTSRMMAYDPRTGELEEVFEDQGYGRIFAGAGGFFCKRAGEDYGDIAYWIASDGEGVIELGQGEPLGLDTASFGGTESAGTVYVTLRDQSPDFAGDLFIVSGMEETARAVRAPQESLEYCGMAGEYAIYLVCDTEAGTNFLYSLSGADGKSVCLGEMPIEKGEYQYPYLEAEQMLSDEKGVYLVASSYEGTGHFRTYSLVVSAVPGEENSLQLLSHEQAYTEDGTEAALPKLFLTGPGEPQIVPGIPGQAALSEVTYGDLIYIDSPYSAMRLIFDYLPYTDWEEPQRKILQTAEVIGDSVYVILAEANRAEEDDIGWRMAYSLGGLTWERVPISEGLAQEGSSRAEVIEQVSWNASVSEIPLVLGNTVGVWKMYSYESEGRYGLAEEENISYYLTIHEDGTADYDPTVNGVETLGAQGMEIRSEEGNLTFGFKDEETGWNRFKIVACERGVMQVLYEYHYGDGSTGVMKSEYHKVQ